MANKEQMLSKLKDEGFDNSFIDEDEDLTVVCSQCEAAVLNGVACHEHGCPNIVRE